MFTFIKQLFGFDKPTMKEAGVQIEQVPYKVEPAPVNPQCSDSVTQPDGSECNAVAAVVETQITDAVTQAPAKKPRKPRAPKAPVAEKPVVKKAAPVKKAAAMKVTPKKTKSKKA
jgi:hypothetical protein